MAGTLMPAPVGRETKAERKSREAQDVSYLEALYREREQMQSVVAADGAMAGKAKLRVSQIEAEIKRCGGTVPAKGARGGSPVGDGGD